MSSKPYQPPRGALAIPHQRTVPDILERSAVINLVALVAYYHLLHVLPRHKSSIYYGPIIRFLLPILGVLIPELLPVQLCSWLIQHHISKSSAGDGSQDVWNQEKEKGAQDESASKSTRWAWKHAILAAFNSVPLWLAVQAYRERLAMRYHEATYVGNLFIDHRNGWAASVGLIAGITTVSILLYIHFFGYLRTNVEYRNPGFISPERLEEAAANSSTRLRSRWTTFVSVPFSPFTVIDFNARLEVYLASLIHQFPLMATNRVPPISILLNTHVLLSYLFIAFALSSLAAFATVNRFKGSGFSVKSRILHYMWIYTTTAFVFATIYTQARSEVQELQQVSRGEMKPWNYRWQVKDRLSQGDNDRVYMG